MRALFCQSGKCSLFGNPINANRWANKCFFFVIYVILAITISLSFWSVELELNETESLGNNLIQRNYCIMSTRLSHLSLCIQFTDQKIYFDWSMDLKFNYNSILFLFIFTSFHSCVCSFFFHFPFHNSMRQHPGIHVTYLLACLLACLLSVDYWVDIDDNDDFFFFLLLIRFPFFSSVNLCFVVLCCSEFLIPYRCVLSGVLYCRIEAILCVFFFFWYPLSWHNSFQFMYVIWLNVIVRMILDVDVDVDVTVTEAVIVRVTVISVWLERILLNVIVVRLIPIFEIVPCVDSGNLNPINCNGMNCYSSIHSVDDHSCLRGVHMHA